MDGSVYCTERFCAIKQVLLQTTFSIFNILKGFCAIKFCGYYCTEQLCAVKPQKEYLSKIDFRKAMERVFVKKIFSVKAQMQNAPPCERFPPGQSYSLRQLI